MVELNSLENIGEVHTIHVEGGSKRGRGRGNYYSSPMPDEYDTKPLRPLHSPGMLRPAARYQTKSIPALVCFSLPPALRDVKVFRGKQEPVSMVQYLSHPVRTYICRHSSHADLSFIRNICFKYFD